MIRSRRALAPVAFLALVLACQSNGPASPESGDSGPVVVRVELSAADLALGPDVDRTSFTLANLGTATIEWRIESISADWIAVSPRSGEIGPGEPVTITVTVDRLGLAKGTHRATLRVVAGGKTLDVAVTLEHAGSPRAALAPASLDLAPSDASGKIRVQNTGDATLEWSFSGPDWVDFSPASGSVEPGAEVAVLVTPARERLDPGVHSVELTLESNGGDSTVTLTVQVPVPARLRLDPSSLDFGEGAVSKTLVVINDGEVPLDWSADPRAGWVTAQPGAGSVAPTASQAVTVRVSRTGLAAGAHQTALDIRSNGGDASVSVAVEVPAPPSDGGDSDGGDSDGGDSGDSGTVALEGRVLDQFSRTGVAGLTVHFDSQTVTTGGDGRFRLEGAPSHDLRPLGLSKSGTVSRSTFARTGDGEWLVIPGSFDMAAFDDMAREYEPRTIRWVVDPDVYFDVTPPTGFPPGSEYDVWVEEVRGVIASFISAWTQGRIRAASLTVGTSPPPAGTPGVIVIGFSEDPSVYTHPGTVGLARTFWSHDRTIHSVRIWLRFSLIQGSHNSSLRTAVVGHELGHGLGMGHMDGGTASIMTPSISAFDLTTFDRRAGDIVYTRSPGNTSPDTDNSAYYRGGLVAAAAGFHEWICSPPSRDLR